MIVVVLLSRENLREIRRRITLQAILESKLCAVCKYLLENVIDNKRCHYDSSSIY